MGSWLSDALLARGDEVVILDNLDPVTHPNGKPSWVPAEAEFLPGDVRIPHDVKLAVSGCDVVFHQAAFGGFAPEPAKMTAVNALGTANVLAACRAAGVRKVVVASSQAVYGSGRFDCAEGWTGPGTRTAEQLGRGDWDVRCPSGHVARVRGFGASEDDPVELPSAYALSKHYAERLALTLGAEWNMPVVALRYSLVFGPRQSVSNPYTGICSIFSTRLLNGLPPVIYEDGLQIRDFTYVADVAAANLLVADDARADGKVFNVGTGVGTSVLDFARMLAAAYGVDVEPELSGEYRPADARHLVTDASRLRALGWAPTVGVDEGVRRYAEWFVEQPRGADRFEAARLEMRQAGIVRGGR